MAKDKVIKLSDDTLCKFRTYNMLMVGKYVGGVKKHGTTVVIDPIEEAQNECIDLSNYAMMTYFKLEGLKKKVGLIEKGQS